MFKHDIHKDKQMKKMFKHDINKDKHIIKMFKHDINKDKKNGKEDVQAWHQQD